MSQTPTPHISANPGDFAKTCLMPGDPLRAKFIADNYLENVIQVNSVRNMFGFTGTYKGKRISVMGSGMGMPSIGIYSYELFNFYDVDNIVRVGSAGALQDDIRMGDLMFGMGACTDSNYAAQFQLPGTYAPIASWKLLSKSVEIAERMGLRYHVGNLNSSDAFYTVFPDAALKLKEMGVMGLEMEAAALYMNAAKAGKHALSMCTCSDHIFTGESMSSKERQESFHDMMKLSLELAYEMD